MEKKNDSDKSQDPNSKKSLAYNLISKTICGLLHLRNKIYSPDTILKEAEIKKGMNVLDFGCGPGHFSLKVSEMVGDGRVYAVDKERFGLEILERQIQKKGIKNISLINSECKIDLPDNSIDVVLLYYVFNDLDNQYEVLKELYRVLKPNGVLSLFEFNQDMVSRKLEKFGWFLRDDKKKRTHTFVKNKLSSKNQKFKTKGLNNSVYLKGRRIEDMVTKNNMILFGIMTIIGLSIALPGTGINLVDADNDGQWNMFDNCPDDHNPLQTDFDLDNMGDSCDMDDDNDGVNDEMDIFDMDSSEWSDFDGDSIGDNKDTDDDNDGVSDSLDQFDTNPNDWADFDFDGIGSSVDTDDDNDGILDTEDTTPILSSENMATKYLDDIRICADMDDGTLRLLCYSQFFGRVVENEENNSDALELSIALSKIGTIDDCHFVSHEIGHIAFEETKDVTKSLHNMDGTMCRGGYFHGVLASYFHEVEESGKSFPASYQTVCDDLIGSSNYQDCVHGLGHGLVHYFGDDLNSAVDKCNALSFYQDILCTKGVMMQYTDDILTRKGISQESVSDLCIESELGKLNYHECSMSLGTTIAFFTNHNFDEGKVSCELIEDEKTQKLCLDGLRLEIEDSEKYEITPLSLEKREKYQPQFVGDKTVDIRTPSIISNFSYSKDMETILFFFDRSGYVIMYVPFDLLPNGEAILTVNGKVPTNLASNDTAIKDHVAITFEADSGGIVFLGPK